MMDTDRNNTNGKRTGSYAFWKAVDFFIPVLEEKEGYIRRQLARTGLAVLFSSATIYPLNENENQREILAQYDWDLSCSVPDDVSQAFLYSHHDPADLIVDHPESPYLDRTERVYFKYEKRNVDGAGIASTQVIGACYYIRDGQYRWADAFHQSVAGTREQLSYPEYAPIGLDGGDNDSGYQITLPTPSFNQ